MGEEAKTKERIDLLQPYQISREIMSATKTKIQYLCTACQR